MPLPAVYKTLSKILLLLCSLGLLSSCQLILGHRPATEQGNVLEQKIVKEIHLGMAKDEVIAAIGTPVLTNTLSPTELYYVYTVQVGYHRVYERKLVLHFINGKLAKYDAHLA